MSVEDEVAEALSLRVVGADLAVDEAEEPLPGGAEEVITAVERRLVEGRDVGGAFEYCGQGLAGVGADVHDGLAGVEAFHEQHVHPGLKELPCR